MRPWLLVPILAVAALLRLEKLEDFSLWYDEVVSMRLAREPGPAAMVRLLDRIDATRAPLHPILLHGWLRLVGDSDYAGQLFSVVCGVATVALAFWVGRLAFDTPTGLWAAWQCALSPLLVEYSREVRMYAWLVLVTCLAWGLLFSFRRSAGIGKQAAFGLALIALIYSHPLGLLMIAALGVAYLADRSRSRLSWRAWLAIQVLVGLAVAPWLGRYLDHEPEVASAEWLAPKYLVGLPIGFVGGDSRLLVICVGFIAWGAVTVRRKATPRVAPDRPESTALLLIWFALPPLLLYGYSWVGHPLFGPARYTLFVAPAYLILLGRGLSKMTWLMTLLITPYLATVGLAWTMDRCLINNSKADWRRVARLIGGDQPPPVVVVASDHPTRNYEVVTARYYLPPEVTVLPLTPDVADRLMDLDPPPPWIWVAIGKREDRTVVPIPARIGPYLYGSEFNPRNLLLIRYRPRALPREGVSGKRGRPADAPE